jgi:hypothetical protein
MNLKASLIMGSSRGAKIFLERSGAEFERLRSMEAEFARDDLRPEPLLSRMSTCDEKGMAGGWQSSYPKPVDKIIERGEPEPTGSLSEPLNFRLSTRMAAKDSEAKYSSNWL